MKSYKVPCVYGRTADRDISVKVPGSKSITNRALLLATLARGKSVLNGVLFSDDSRHFAECVEALGIKTLIEEEASRITVWGNGKNIPGKAAELYVGSAGTAARFMTALTGISDGTYRLDASAQMRKRPMKPLLDTLSGLGAEISYEEREGFFPYTVKGAGLLGADEITAPVELGVDIGDSSQFLSALLIAMGSYSGSSLINVTGNHGMAYIDMTAKMMEQFGVSISKRENSFMIPEGSCYRPLNYDIEPDASAACYFYAMALLLGISVTVPGIHMDSLQGDVGFLSVLKQMGAEFSDTPEGICVTGRPDGSFCGVDADMHSCSDQVITLAAIAPFAETPTRITGAGHIRFQESNRIAAVINELTRMGIRCEELEDGMIIYPGKPQPSLVNTYEDHRMAMGFSLTGLRAEGIEINDCMCCRKTFENYFEVLDSVLEQLTI